MAAYYFDSLGHFIPFFEYYTPPAFSFNIQRYLLNKIHYSFNTGHVVVRFKISKDGTPRDVRILQGLTSELDAEVLAAFTSMPRLKPGLVENIPIDQIITASIGFGYGKGMVLDEISNPALDPGSEYCEFDD